jgi:hypothetical protein
MKTLLAGLLLASGCMAGASTYGWSSTAGTPLRRPIAAPAGGAADGAAPGGPAGAYAPGEDAHWFSADDYLVTKETFQGKPINYLRVAKLLEAPAGNTTAEARFLNSLGEEVWTASFWRTRVAAPKDLAVGALAFCHMNSGYRTETAGPHDKHESRHDGWLVAAITDTSDSYKGRVSVGSMSCPIAAVRVPIR